MESPQNGDTRGGLPLSFSDATELRRVYQLLDSFR